MQNSLFSSSSENPEWKVASLADYEKGFFDGSKIEDQYFAFADPSNFANAPGWMLRNLLVLLKRRWGIHKAQILIYRDVPAKRELGRSLTVHLQVDSIKDTDTGDSSASDKMPNVTGWERNSAGKLAGRLSDLTAYMDPRR